MLQAPTSWTRPSADSGSNRSSAPGDLDPLDEPATRQRGYEDDVRSVVSHGGDEGDRHLLAPIGDSPRVNRERDDRPLRVQHRGDSGRASGVELGGDGPRELNPLAVAA